jgi:predicted site-specific integrase-resolvase
MQTNDLVGSLEASTILGVSHATFNRWAKQGRIPVAIKAAGKTGLRLFERSDIEALAEQPTRRAS